MPRMKTRCDTACLNVTPLALYVKLLRVGCNRKSFNTSIVFSTFKNSLESRLQKSHTQFHTQIHSFLAWNSYIRTRTLETPNSSRSPFDVVLHCYIVHPWMWSTGKHQLAKTVTVFAATLQMRSIVWWKRSVRLGPRGVMQLNLQCFILIRFPKERRHSIGGGHPSGVAVWPSVQNLASFDQVSTEWRFVPSRGIFRSFWHVAAITQN